MLCSALRGYRVQRWDTSNVHRIAGLTARYFTESIYRGKLIVLGVCTMAPCYEKKKIKIKKEGKEEINATYGVIVRVIAFTFQLQLFASTFFQLEFFPSKEEREIYIHFFHYELARFEAIHDLREREKEKCENTIAIVTK